MSSGDETKVLPNGGNNDFLNGDKEVTDGDALELGLLSNCLPFPVKAMRSERVTVSPYGLNLWSLTRKDTPSG